MLGTTKPPLTLAWLAAGLRRIGCDVRVVDLTASRQSIDTLIDELGRAAWRPTLILFASTFPTWDADARAAAALKAATGAPVIAFGPPASASPRAAPPSRCCWRWRATRTRRRLSLAFSWLGRR